MLGMNKIVSFTLIFFFISGTFATAFNPVSASGLVENSWNTKTPMSQARAALGVVAVEGKIYAIGGSPGHGFSSFVGTNECYDPKTDTWVTLKSMPTPRAGFAIVAYQDKIHCIGGSTFSIDKGGILKLSTVVEVYDIATDSWSAKPPVSFIINSGVHIADEKIFGITTGLSTNSLFLYNPITDECVKPMLTPNYLLVLQVL